MDWDLDLVFLTKLEDPYLASDGITYSRESLLAAMQADPWHRSPVTTEVLRPMCYRNKIVADLLGEEGGRCSDDVLTIYNENELPENGATITWTLPSLCTAKVAAVKMKWNLDEVESLSVTAHTLRDTASVDWLMHPPPAEEMWNDIVEFASIFNIHKCVPNPWCLTTAKLNHSHRTVEEQWFASH